MANGKFVAYYRVSTQRQGQSGLGLEAQREAVKRYLNGGCWELIQEFTEVESGRKTDRPRLREALEACRKQGATLIIAKLDRLARKVSFVSSLMDSKVQFIACDNPHATPLTIHILAAVAEQEARDISARTKAALGAAKARGRKLGWANPMRSDEQKLAAERGAAKQRAEADKFAQNVYPVIQAIQSAGLSGLSEIAKALNARGIRTDRGRQWYPATVSNVLKRVAA